ncbi:hypothetical protein [Caudoviricetes sp.]|nr:hypothetical protein [Caudoviricetes sp.]
MARRKSDKRKRHEEELSEWQSGTDLRDESGYYRIPRGLIPPVDDPADGYPSVTTILDLLVDFTYPDRWWIASEVVDIARASMEKRKVPVWLGEGDGGQLVEVMGGQILLNQLPERFGSNAGKWWIARAGARELQRRANRGTLIHDAILDWAFNGTRVDWDDVSDYGKTLAEARGFALDESYYVQSIRNALAWCERHLDPESMILCESPVFNWDYIFAGTVDYFGPLRNTDKLAFSPADEVVANASELVRGVVVKDSAKWLIDFKGSKGPKMAHRLQAAAYANSNHYIERTTSGFGSFVEMPRADRVANVYVTDDYVHLKEWGDEGDPWSLDDSFSAFIYASMIFAHIERETLHAPASIKSMSFKRPTPEDFRRYRGGGR